MAFNGWNKGMEFNGNTKINAAGLLIDNRKYNQIVMQDTDGYLGVVHFGDGDFQLDSRDTDHDSNNRTLFRVRSNAATNDDIKNAVWLSKIGGSNAGTYKIYGEHNWGAALSGTGGIDYNTTANPAYAGYYKFASLRQRPVNYSRTSALFYLLGEDIQYRPILLYITSRLNVPTTTTAGYNLMTVTNYVNYFGTSIDTNLTNRIYICANKPTSVTNNTTVDLYWYQDAGYNQLRYYLLHGSCRGGYTPKMDLYTYIDLYNTTNTLIKPTLTNLTSTYSYVWKLSDCTNTAVNIQY